MIANDIYYDDAYRMDEVGVDATEIDEGDVLQIRGRQVFKFFIVGLLFCFLSGLSDTAGPFFVAARLFLLALLGLTVFMPSRIGVPFYFLLLLVSPDIIQSSTEEVIYGEQNIASLWRASIGPLRPSWIIFLVSALLLARNLYGSWDRRIKLAIVWFASVPIITGLIYGGFGTIARTVEVPTDMRLGMLLMTSILLFTSFLRRNPSALPMMLALFLGGLLAVHLGNMIYWLSGRGPMIAGISRASVDSAKSTIVFVLLFGIHLIAIRRRLLLGTILALGSVLLIIVFATRLIWLTSIICVVILLHLLGVKRILLLSPVAALLIFGGGALIKSLQSESIRIAALRAETLKPTGGNYIANIDPLRYGEILNSTATSFRRVSILWGNGYGSYYTDDVMPFPQDLTTAFPEYSASLGQFFYCHNYVSQLFFKHGLIGLVLISLLWISPAWMCWKYVFDRRDRSTFNGFLACLIALIPTVMLCMYWTGKGLIINGFIIAVLLFIAEQYAGGKEPVGEE
ncbi:MAG TPA: hypothetical protein ENN81_02095 [Phycisphaerales bacterium]|nr:hypothetical protein [Phycisphaerales bacterium]